MRRLTSLFALCLTAAAVVAQEATPAQDQRPNIDPKLGEWITFPDDASPWKHPHTDLRFPRKLGEYELKYGFLDKLADGGIALTYFGKNDLKADILLTPCPKAIAIQTKIMPSVEEHLRQMGKALRSLAESQGFVEDEAKRGKLESGQIELWEIGAVPSAQMKMEFQPKTPGPEAPPAINQWLNVTLYQDYWMQTSLFMPSAQGMEGEKQRVEFMTQLMGILREPSMTPHLLKLCAEYLKDPLSDKSKEGADALFAYSKQSAIFEITMPGETITSTLTEVANLSPGNEKEVLRGYLVGAGAATLLNVDINDRFEEGVRVMVLVYDALKKKNMQLSIPKMEELAKLSAEKKAAEWIVNRINSPLVD
jgi:hypothetical protein